MFPGEEAASLAGFPFGPQRLRGIPFALLDPAANGGRCWIVLSGDRAANLPDRALITLPAPAPVGYVVFAHFTDLELPEARVGELVATYIAVLANGRRVSWPIRRRFEIAARRPALGTRGFATVEHVEARAARTAGPGTDGLTGQSFAASAQRYWLWGARNPEPREEIVAIELTAEHADVVAIGGITLARDRSNPLRRSPRTAIRIDLPRPSETAAAAGAPFAEEAAAPAPSDGAAVGGVSLAIDVGEIVRVARADDPTADGWCGAPLTGWGEPPNEARPRRVYAEVTAADSADLVVRRGGATWTVPWRDVTSGRGRSADGALRVRVAHARLARVRVQVVDADTGREIPARVHFRGPSGEYLPPRGHSADVNVDWCQDIGGDLRLGATSYAYVPGRFEADLPVGTVYAEVVRGFEYTPLREVLTITPGQTELRLALRRWTDARRSGYRSGDVHVHFLDPATAALEAAAEDLSVTELLAAQWGRLYTNVEHGIGREASTSTSEHVIRLDSENRHHVMGHLFLLGLREPVLPLSSGGPTEDEIGGWEEVALADWCDRARAQGGLVVAQFMPTPHAEVVADVALGKIDATEVRWFDFGGAPPGGHWGDTPFAFPGVAQWYRYLSCGYRLPAAGGTDKMTNAIAVGALRTYVRLEDGDQFDYASWSRALKRGRTFVTTGPLIELEVEGRVPGDEIALPPGGGTLEAVATARSAQPFDAVEIVVNGEVAARAPADPGGRAARVSARLRLGASSWVAARCHGREKLQVIWPIAVGAHTSPVYVTVGGRRQTSTGDADYLLTLLEGGLAYLDNLAAFRDPAQRRHHRGVLVAGRRALLRHHRGARPHWHAGHGRGGQDAQL
ncbi:MAG TPA: CehA/McbA family metallohydrolase [Chloroflexota bacterium]|nr:CehA/McbA family metallohydrolase [Chloroflexota bacterium]